MGKQHRNRDDQWRQDSWSWDQNRNRNNREDDFPRQDQSRKYGDTGYGNQDYRNVSSDRERYSRDSWEPRDNFGNNSNDWRQSDWRDNEHRVGNNRGNYGHYGNTGNSSWDREEGLGEGKFGMNYGREDFGRRNAGYMNDYGNSRDRGDYSGQRNSGFRTGDNDSRDRSRRDWWDRTVDEVSSWFGDEDAQRRRERDERQYGGYRGKGPKEYKRSQERIQEDVCDRLTDDDYLDASNISVEIQGNDVVLSGTVNSREQKRRAEDLVERISGVHNVENRIRIDRTAEGNNTFAGPRTTKISDDITDNDRNRIV